MAMTRGQSARALARRMRETTFLGDDHVEVNAGDLHREVGVYPDLNHGMPTCCRAMRAAMRPADVVLSEPLKGAAPDQRSATSCRTVRSLSAYSPALWITFFRT
jgi:hypothetical protein